MAPPCTGIVVIETVQALRRFEVLALNAHLVGQTGGRYCRSWAFDRICVLWARRRWSRRQLRVGSEDAEIDLS